MRTILGLLPVMLFACGEKAADADGDSGIRVADGDATNGAALYASSCAGCHGADGTGLSAPDLTTGLVASLSDAGLVDVIANGIGSMPAITSDDQEIADLVAYLRQEWG